MYDLIVAVICVVKIIYIGDQKVAAIGYLCVDIDDNLWSSS